MEKEPPDGLRWIHRRRHGRVIQIEIPDLSTGFGKIFNFSEGGGEGELAVSKARLQFARRDARERERERERRSFVGPMSENLENFPALLLKLVRLAYRHRDLSSG